MPAADDAPPPTARDEQALAGGMANVGRVVRVGDTVRRPHGAHSEAVDALLGHLASVGFDGAPRPLGVDEQGRSTLSYVDGDVGIPPYPRWSAGAELLVSVAALQRRYHDAVRSFAPPAGTVWNTTLADADAEGGGDGGNRDGGNGRLVIGHNDLCVENVVCRDGRAVAFIDFDFAGPVDPLWDVAIALRHWVPIRDPEDLDEARADVDQPARFRAYCEVYGVRDDEHSRLVRLGLRFLDRAFEQMKTRAEAGQPGYLEAWRNGYAAQNRRSHAWLAGHADQLAAG